MPFIFYVGIREKKDNKSSRKFSCGGKMYIVMVYMYVNSVHCRTNNVPWDLFDVI